MITDVDERTVLDRLRRAELHVVMRKLGVPYEPSTPATTLRLLIKSTPVTNEQILAIINGDRDTKSAAKAVKSQSDTLKEVDKIRADRRVAIDEALKKAEGTIGLKNKDAIVVEETYFDMAYEEMYTLARERGIAMPTKPNKTELIRTLHGYDAVNGN